jgi:hypothetical protein
MSAFAVDLIFPGGVMSIDCPGHSFDYELQTNSVGHLDTRVLFLLRGTDLAL